MSFEENSYGIVKRLRIIKSWLKEFQTKPQLRILDYGCGTGEQITYPLALDGHEVTGIDLHEPSIATARERYKLPNLNFHTGTLSRITSHHQTFDAIVCSEVIEHLDDPAPVLEELRGLLSPGGLLIVTTPNGYGSYEMLCSVERWLGRRAIYRLLRQLLNTSPKEAGHASAGFLNFDSVHVQFFRLQDLEKLFHQSSFQIVERRARTLFCGPYVDVLFNVMPLHRTLFSINNLLADILPFACAADWMFLLRLKTEHD